MEGKVGSSPTSDTKAFTPIKKEEHHENINNNNTYHIICTECIFL
jgi:hypothetical protein